MANDINVFLIFIILDQTKINKIKKLLINKIITIFKTSPIINIRKKNHLSNFSFKISVDLDLFINDLYALINNFKMIYRLIL